MKTCRQCNQEKPLEEFAVNRTKKDGRQGQCKACKKLYYDNYYRTSPKEKARLLANNKALRQSNVQFINELKSKPCTDCGESYPPYVMDFDHLDESLKTRNVSTMTIWSRAAIEKEISKCELVCSNCHRIRTHERRNAQ